MSFIVSVYGSHNAAIAFYYNGQYSIYEVERFIGYKNAGLCQYKFCWPPEIYVDAIINDFKKRNSITSDPDVVIWNRTDYSHDNTYHKMHTTIPAKEYVAGAPHHIAHASGTFYQSTFKKALIVSFDGGGEDGFFNVYQADREQGMKLVGSSNLDLGFAYMIIGQYLNDIKWEPSLSDGNLVYSGKVMGLTGYGKVNKEWLPHFKAFFRSKPDGNNYKEKIQTLQNETGIAFNENYRLKGNHAYDVAATHQQAFEDVFFEIFDPLYKAFKVEDESGSYPICVTGGCALNVLLNTKIKDVYMQPVFVASNSSDCGQAAGMLLDYLKPSEFVDLSRSGTPILDFSNIGEYIYSHSHNSTITKVTPIAVASLLMQGKIIGIVRGNSEHGPRALGHRSIICNPGYASMKDTLNSKVKNREWYRPFAPITLCESEGIYFETNEFSPYMSFAFKVKEEWREKLSSVTHVDGTARVQSLVRMDDEWLYQVIELFGAMSGYKVILNTSFNVAGKPILTTVKDAFEVYDKTQLDCLVIEDYLIIKK